MLARIFILIALLLLAGCGTPTSAVTGKITYHGKPVVLGSVVFVNEENQPSAQETIELDGTYTVHVPHGAYTVTVHSPDPGKRPDITRPLADDLKKKVKDTKIARPGADKWFAIPERYSDWRRSDLTVTVSQPSITFDIELAD